MRRSKLEAYVDILKLLESAGPVKRADFIIKSDVNYNIIQKFEFLSKQGLAETLNVEDVQVLGITKRGLTVLEYFKERTKPTLRARK